MNFFDILNKVNKIHRPITLYCLLNRIPFFIYTEIKEKDVKAILKNLANMIYFRDIFVLFQELNNNEELAQLINSEDIEDLSNRYTVIGHTNDFGQLQQFNDFTSFIITINEINEGDIEKLTLSKFLILDIRSKSINLTIKGLNIKEIDFSFEENVLNKINIETIKPLDDIVYLLKSQLEVFKIPEGSDVWSNTLDIHKERNAIRTTIMQTELQKFISASEKIYMLLRKAYQFEQIDNQLDIKIKAEELIDPIDYHDASIERMLSFIEANWRNNYSRYVV